MPKVIPILMNPELLRTTVRIEVIYIYDKKIQYIFNKRMFSLRSFIYFIRHDFILLLTLYMMRKILKNSYPWLMKLSYDRYFFFSEAINNIKDINYK